MKRSEGDNKESIGSSLIKIGACRIGPGCSFGFGVILGQPSKGRLLRSRDQGASNGLSMGKNCIIRSHTTIYEDAILADEVQTGHNVVIRERAEIGKGCSIGNGADGGTLSLRTLLWPGSPVSQWGMA